MSTHLASVLPRHTSGLAHGLTTPAAAGYAPTAVANHDGFPAYRYESLGFDEFDDDDEFEAAEHEHTARVEQAAMLAAAPGTPR